MLKVVFNIWPQGRGQYPPKRLIDSLHFQWLNEGQRHVNRTGCNFWIETAVFTTPIALLKQDWHVEAFCQVLNHLLNFEGAHSMINKRF